MRFRSLVKRALVHSPIRYSERVDGLLRLTLLRSWIARQKAHPYFPSREAMYAHVAEQVGNVPITYLEFGVFQGSSMRAWTGINTAPESEFFGFDSFEGLPETWDSGGGTFVPGTFSTAGRFPPIDDPRVRFIKGWFHDTLPAFLEQFSPHKPIVVNCDADLYTSTMFVLCRLDPILRPGTILMFDDFSAMLHEFRALEDYTRSFRRSYEVLGAASRDYYYNHVALRFTS
ncbi:MAG TPA: TylF/MycF/NovP-related O-methyltransferase [Thermoanaerobaculia bacterium]